MLQPGSSSIAWASLALVCGALGVDAAAVVHRWRGSGSYDGTPFTDDHRCTTICVRRDGAWRVALEQCTAISGPGAVSTDGSDLLGLLLCFDLQDVGECRYT